MISEKVKNLKAYLIEKRFINFLVNINFAIYFLLTAKLIENYGKPMIETHEKLYIFSFFNFLFYRHVYYICDDY